MGVFTEMTTVFLFPKARYKDVLLECVMNEKKVNGMCAKVKNFCSDSKDFQGNSLPECFGERKLGGKSNLIIRYLSSTFYFIFNIKNLNCYLNPSTCVCK